MDNLSDAEVGSNQGVYEQDDRSFRPPYGTRLAAPPGGGIPPLRSEVELIFALNQNSAGFIEGEM
jgi:hypothetical protein